MKAGRVLLEYLDSFILRLGALDDGRNVLLSDIVENGSELVRGRRLLSDVQLKLRPGNIGRLSGMVACLVLGRSGSSSSVGLLQQCRNPRRGRRTGFVKEGDDVERFALQFTNTDEQLLDDVGPIPPN